ncbi:riboflavin kinase / FMN adenylyltransferase [Thermosyntropha lipolytica DSM 11003]|uniref:Riboflavin biosynthesis protein n=1 Tax=Thermosyntropha lipolytica DSM 11003 TaxID=1123382 RepID=A0A1M5KVC2_9FIRM|nr:bifunctional riboflavin kinase/FAD synthetase [Thermosyntropha lipolytica]SHG56685.1 riboflavin kinase / FMN adenylyltransferase [Thermosyntropha lipolytica DSM 11003]
MEIVREVQNMPLYDKPVYLALGNFDGVHVGHQKLIRTMIEKAHEEGGIAAAFIFDPHPAKIINPLKAPKLLLSAQKKAEFLANMGLDLLIYNSFTEEISKWEPEDFVRKVIVERIKAREVFVGFNYSFGYRGRGNPDLLQSLGDLYGFKVHIIQPVEVDGEIASSSLVRELLAKGDIKRASKILGYYPFVEGRVVEGEKRGREIGFPTANLAVDEDIMIPGKGVYAAIADVDGQKYKCMVNIGNKPTFHEHFPVSIEAHLLDFRELIYGKLLNISFLDKLRDEKKFRGVEELIEQLKRDREQAEKIVSF